MHDVPLVFFMLALVFILTSVFLDWALFHLGHIRDYPIRTDWPIWKQRLVSTLMFSKILTQFFAGLFSMLFVVATVFAIGIG
jgi:hypothetical protein